MISHLVVASRYSGTQIEPHVRRITLGVAYVTDESLLQDSVLSFAKIKYVAIVEAQRVRT